MRELERSSDLPLPPSLASTPLAIVGRGRLGWAISRALGYAGAAVTAPLPRHPDLTEFGAILLCVPDAAITAVAAELPPGRLVGHCSGASGLDVLAPHEAFSIHPLMTVTVADRGDRFAGAGAALAGSTPRALGFARELAGALGLDGFALAESDRAAYHAAASIASNFLITLEHTAERVAAGTGLGRAELVPLVRATVENWARLGPKRALTGPIARRDEATVAAQRAAVAERAPELLAVFDALATATRELAAETAPVPA